MDKGLVAAIDIGNSCSGFAYSFKDDYRKDPTKIYVSTWRPNCMQSYNKQPTCLLCLPNGQFHSFGYTAENKYDELVACDNHHKWYFFQRFQTTMQGKQINSETIIEDDKSLKMPAINVFGMAISYFKNQLLQSLKKHPKADDIHWVFTVPATWTDSAQQFMRDAANKAGIDGRHLTITLAPNAAAMYFQMLSSKHLYSMDTFDDTKYIVLDLNGNSSCCQYPYSYLVCLHAVRYFNTNETADISVYEKQEDGTTKEVHKVCGGPWSINNVAEEFTKIIINIVGATTFNEFCDEHKMEHKDMLFQFKSSAKKFSKKVNEYMHIYLPSELVGIYKRKYGKMINVVITQSQFGGNIECSGQNLHVYGGSCRSLFQNCISKITELLADFLAQPGVKGISTLLMVGEFSDYQIMQEAIRNVFPEVFIPTEGGLSVVKGAVILGNTIDITSQDENDISSDDNLASCSNTYEQDIHHQSGIHLKCESLSEEAEHVSSGTNVEIILGRDDKGTTALETKIENQKSFKDAQQDENEISSDDNLASYEQDVCRQRGTHLKCESLSEEAEQVSSGKKVEILLGRDDRGTTALETKLEHQKSEGDVERAPTDDELFILSRKLDKRQMEWWILAKLLGLSDEIIEEIEHGGFNIVRQYYKMLRAWKRQNAGKEQGSVGFLLRQCNKAGIDRELTKGTFRE